jgi:hypothetical protein
MSGDGEAGLISHFEDLPEHIQAAVRFMTHSQAGIVLLTCVGCVSRLTELRSQSRRSCATWIPCSCLVRQHSWRVGSTSLTGLALQLHVQIWCNVILASLR